MPPRRRRSTDPLARAILGVSKPLLSTAGHRLHTEPDGERWRAKCSCDWKSKPRDTSAQALRSGVKHVSSALGAKWGER